MISLQCITKTCLCKFDPLKSHVYIVKRGFTGVYIIFLSSAQGGSNEYPQSMFWVEIWKISEFFLSENFQFLEVKFSIYLNRRVFVMERVLDNQGCDVFFKRTMKILIRLRWCADWFKSLGCTISEGMFSHVAANTEKSGIQAYILLG